jgi:hypothetical protein
MVGGGWSPAAQVGGNEWRFGHDVCAVTPRDFKAHAPGGIAEGFVRLAD